MKTKINENLDDDWFHKLDSQNNQVSSQYKKLNYKNRLITKNQRLLNEYNILKSKNKIKLVKNDAPFDEKILLRRININNYKELDRDNMTIKNILAKLEERKISKSIKKLKKIKTNNEYEQLSYIRNHLLKPNYKLKLNNELYSQKNNSNLSVDNNKLKAQYLKYYSNTPTSTDRNLKEKPKKSTLHKNIKINTEDINFDNKHLSSKNSDKNINELGKVIVKREMTDNNSYFFQTLTRVGKYEEKDKRKKSNKFEKIQNLYEMIKAVKDEDKNCQKSGKKIYDEILNIKNKKYLNNINKSNIINTNSSINYSKIKNRKDIEKKIFNTPKIHIFDYLKENMKIKTQKRVNSLFNDEEKDEYFDTSIKKVKNSLILPLCPTSQKN